MDGVDFNMNISLPILLLMFGGLSFWLMTESSLKWYIKTACISTFCIFTVIFWTTIHSYLGWPADENDIPETVRVHWVVIKEPNKQTGYKGDIFFLLESAHEEKSTIRKFFGYKKSDKEPRLYGLPYDRKLHEDLAKNMIPKLKSGQPIVGKITKKIPGKSEKAKGKIKSKGGGSESQAQQWHFHELRPSEFLRKPTD